MEDELKRDAALLHEMWFNDWSRKIGLGAIIVTLAFALSMVTELWDFGWGSPTYVMTIVKAMAVVLPLAVIPLTYGVGGSHMHNGRAWAFFQPMRGGLRFVVFQALGWMFFALSIVLPSLPWLAAWFYPSLVLKGLTICGGASAVLSEVMIVTSLLMYRKPRDHRTGDGATPVPDPAEIAMQAICGKDQQKTKLQKSQSKTRLAQALDVDLTALADHTPRMVSERRQFLKNFIASSAGEGWWRMFLLLQIALASFGCGVAIVSDLWGTRDIGIHAVLSSFGLACAVVAVCLTHGIGGQWKGRQYGGAWAFFTQRGGSWRFALLQWSGWMVLAVSVIIFGMNLVRVEDAPSMLVGGLSGVLAEILMALSLVVYDGKNAAAVALSPSQATALRKGQREDAGWEIIQPKSIAANVSESNEAGGKKAAIAPPPYPPAAPSETTSVSYDSSFTHYSHGVSLWIAFLRTILATAVYNTQNMVFVATIISVVIFVRIYPKLTVALWVLGWILYPLSFLGAPNSRGTRVIKWFRGHWMFRHLSAYFDLKIVYDSTEPLPPTTGAQRYIFGFHPHGVIPLTIGWATLSDLWVKMFPGIHPAPLASSVLHVVPLTRDLNQMFGGYAVTRTGFLSALRTAGSAIFIPGGQYEMIHTSSTSKTVILNSRHRGFVKVALQTGSDLVPIFSFGEQQIFDNAPSPKSWQKWAMKLMRANVFFMPYGQYFMSIPRQAPVRLAVGKPIKVPCVENASDELVNALRDHYFTELLKTAYRLREQCDSADMDVVVEPPLPEVNKERWEAIVKEIAKKEKGKQGEAEAAGSKEVLVEEDALANMVLEHVSWTNEMTYCAGFFVVVSAIVAVRSGLFV